MKNLTYAGAAQRTFQQALIHCLQTDYALLGSQKVLALIAEDIQRLVEQFYPPSHYLSPGWMLYTGTRASGNKPHPGMSAAEFELVTLAWPVLTLDDILELIHLSDTKEDRRGWQIKRLIRIIEYGLSQKEGAVLLTLADLGLMLGLTHRETSDLLKEARQQTGKELPTKGYYFDMGIKPTHKSQVIELYEQGYDEVAIARKTHHEQSSVGKYIRDYERVKEALEHRIHLTSIPRLLDILPSVVNAYIELVKKYHPEIEIDVKDLKST